MRWRTGFRTQCNTIKVRDHPWANDIKVYTFELQLLKLTSSSSSFTILNIYRPPNSSVAVFLDNLADTISTICASSNDKLLLCSDLNCPSVDSSSINSGLALEQLVGGPARDNNLLDVLATDDPSDNVGCMSDHWLICVKLDFGKPLPKSVESTYCRIDCMVESIGSSNRITKYADDCSFMVSEKYDLYMLDEFKHVLK